MVRNWDVDGRLLLTDIAAPGFQPPSGLELRTLMREIHGRPVRGQMVTGVEVFREIYARLGFGRSVAISRLPLVRQLLQLGYAGFAAWRFRAAVRRMPHLLKTGRPCNRDKCAPDGGCQ